MTYRIWVGGFVLLASSGAWPGEAASQARPRSILPELRLDVTTADVNSAHLSAGVNTAAGTYLRLALVAGAGQWWGDGESGASYQVEAQGRFHLDPFRTSKFGLYGLGGVVTTHYWRSGSVSRLVAGAGVELPAHGRAAWVLEAALAGGFRVSLVSRRLPPGRR